MYKQLNASLSDLWGTGRPAQIDIRMTRRIMRRPLAQLAAIIRTVPRAQADPGDRVHIDPGRRFAMRIPSSVVEVWIRKVAGAFLISICFLVGFIAADRWMSSRQHYDAKSLQRICSSVLELYKRRDEITDNEKWQQDFRRLQDDCAARAPQI
jgi:hypothetical protein